MLKEISIMSLLVFALNIGVFAQGLVPKHNDKGLFGYGDKNSKTFAIKAQWDEARPFNEYGIAIVRKGEMFGMIDTKGKPVGKSMGYSIIAQFDGTDMYLVALGGKRVDNTKAIKNRIGLSTIGFKGSLSYPIVGAKWGVVKPNGQFVLDPIYQEISSAMTDGIVVFQLKNLFGFANINGKKIKEPLYDAVMPFNNQGISAVRTKKTQKWSLIDSNGNVLIDEKQNILAFSQLRNDVWGSPNVLGADSVLKNPAFRNDPERIMPLMTFSSSWINSEHQYIAGTKGEKVKKQMIYDMGLYDLNGNIVIPFGNGFGSIYAPSDDIAITVKNDGQMGFYNIKDNTYSPVASRVYLPFKSGYSMSYILQNNIASDFYLVNKNGDRVSERFDDLLLTEDRYIVKKGNKFGLIDLTGKEVIAAECLELNDASDGYFVIRNSSGTIGYADKNGNIVVPFEYSDGSNFIKGYAVVAKNVEGQLKKKRGIISQTNNIIIPIEYDKVTGYVDENGNLTAWVSNSDFYSEMNLKTGAMKTTEYVEMQNVGYGIVVKNNSGAYGLLVNGKEVIPCSIEDSDMLYPLYSYMNNAEIDSITSMEARMIALRLEGNCNKFKLSDKISSNYWDF